MRQVIVVKKRFTRRQIDKDVVLVTARRNEKAMRVQVGGFTKPVRQVDLQIVARIQNQRRWHEGIGVILSIGRDRIDASIDHFPADLDWLGPSIKSHLQDTSPARYARGIFKGQARFDAARLKIRYRPRRWGGRGRGIGRVHVGRKWLWGNAQRIGMGRSVRATKPCRQDHRRKSASK